MNVELRSRTEWYLSEDYRPSGGTVDLLLPDGSVLLVKLIGIVRGIRAAQRHSDIA